MQGRQLGDITLTVAVRFHTFRWILTVAETASFITYPSSSYNTLTFYLAPYTAAKPYLSTGWSCATQVDVLNGYFAKKASKTSERMLILLVNNGDGSDISANTWKG